MRLSSKPPNASSPAPGQPARSRATVIRNYLPRQVGVHMNERVAIVGVGWAGFRSVTPDVSYKELMYAAAVRAYADAGVDPLRDIDSFVTVAEDFHEGTSIFDEYTPDQLGAVLKPMHTIGGGRLHRPADYIFVGR